VSVIPVRCGLIIPSDVTPESWSNGGERSWSRCARAIEKQVVAFRDYLAAQVGATFDYTLETHVSRLTKRRMASTPGTDDGAMLDSHGQGAHESVVIGEVVLGEKAWPNSEHRWWIYLVNGGGWAGGRSDLGPDGRGPDKGHMIIGDWQFKYWVTGQPDKACVSYYGADSRACIGAEAHAHEALHSFNVLCHAGDVLGDGTELREPTYPPLTPLLSGQVEALRRFNRRFLREA
jgi:hypothetical protein